MRNHSYFVYHSSSFSLVQAEALYDSRAEGVLYVLHASLFLERKEYHQSFPGLLSLNGLGWPSLCSIYFSYLFRKPEGYCIEWQNSRTYSITYFLWKYIYIHRHLLPLLRRFHGQQRKLHYRHLINSSNSQTKTNTASLVYL